MKIVVVGGGSSGWLTALFCQRYFPDYSITVIEDSKTGIIGVGESTTPSLVDLLDFIGISVKDLVINCGATLKNSVKFTNWNNDNKSYCNGFNTIPELDIFSTSYKTYYSKHNIMWPAHTPLSALKEIHSNNTLDDIHFSAIMSNNNQIPIDSTTDYHYASFALHFDARKFANYLKKISIDRNITLVDSKIVQSHLHENGNVKALILENGSNVECDFVFDCSGFARLFVDKTYNAEFKSFQEYLPVKKAIPFFLKNDSYTPSFTEAISMKHGWMWKTPVEGRFGCGYVFDSDYVSDDDAYTEICQVVGEEVVSPRTINFESGYYKTPWNRNTLAIGLSSGFLEPLEATSIWMTVISLHLLIDHVSALVHNDHKAIKEYNKEFYNKIESILALVRLHYHTARQDTPFWREFFIKNKTPKLLEEILEIYSYRMPSLMEGPTYNAFPTHSWYNVVAGNNILSRDVIDKAAITFNIDTFTNNNFKNKLLEFSDRCYNHDMYLNKLRGN